MRTCIKVALLLFLAFAPSKMFACAACAGADVNSPMALGMNWAIYTLLAVVFVVLSAFISGLVYAIRKSEEVEAAAHKNEPAMHATKPSHA